MNAFQVKRVFCLRPVLLLLAMTLSFPLSATPQETSQEPPSPRTPREIAELRADIMMARKLYSDAIEAYEVLLKKEPKNAELLNKIGVGYSNLTKLDKAKKYYERAIKANPKYASALNNLGTVHFYQKKFRRAIKVYERAIAVNPNSATFHGNAGHAWFADKKYPQAITAWVRALELDPQVFEHRGGAGGTILQTSSVEQRSIFYFYMAKTYASLNNAERCAHFLKRAIDEGYKKIAEIEKDPAFASVINDPLVKEALQTPPPTPLARPTT
ncbi:MAG: tetratricopeptide repeat protein [Acidobacteria bacterium]|nr:tetratricopeptide repeat protein [Acidobacteriota bacterium]